jgi:tripartite-type tricarboxylate transporter receptor subunit TctC
MPRVAKAQAYPARPVRFVVGFPPGGVNDITARLMGQWLSERMGQNFLVDNRSGAAGNIGTEAVVRAPADGYTILLTGTTDFTNATAYEKLSFNFVRDIAPVAGIIRAPLVMEVNPSVPARTVPEFIAYLCPYLRRLDHRETRDGPLADGLLGRFAFRVTQSLNAAS